MKKKKILIITGMLAGICLMGCGAKERDTGFQISQEHYAAAEAEQTVVELSEAEKRKQEKQRKKEIEESYAIYEPYGLFYDSERDLFFYNSEIVRYFKDAISISETNGFFYENGTVDLTASRDENGKLKGLVKASSEEFDERSKKYEISQEEFGNAVGEVTYACEEGEPDQRDSSLDPYMEYEHSPH